MLHEFAGGVDDGRYPFGNLIQAGTTLYGATSQGGDNDRGTIFSINTDGSDYTLLYEFAGGADDGNYPQNIIIHDSTLYGLTEQGGNNDSGTVFSFSLGPTFTPTPTAMLQSKRVISSSSMPSAPSCGDTKPNGTPDLFQIDVNNTQATLYFAPVSKADKYYIAYGNGQSIHDYGVEFATGVSDGVISYTVNHLLPNSEYSFVVRGGNGCMPGEWGNTMRIKTGGLANSGTTYYKNFAAKILSIFPRQI